MPHPRIAEAKDAQLLRRRNGCDSRLCVCARAAAGAPAATGKVASRRHEASVKKVKIAKSQSEAQEYHKLLALRLKEARERRSESLAKRRASSIASKDKGK